MSVILYQSPDGYCYNSDSIFLYAFIKEQKIKGKVLDIGCGVGVLSTLISRDFNTETYAVEKQKSMYLYAVKNFEVNKQKVNIQNCDFAEYKPNVLFDYIVSNPPFYKVDKNQSPNQSKNIARYEHHLPLKLLINKSSKLLKQRGYFIFCYDAWQLDDIMIELKNSGMKAEYIRFIHPKANKEAKTVMIAARKGSNAKCKIMPPFIVFNEKEVYNMEAKEAFKVANAHSIKAIYD